MPQRFSTKLIRVCHWVYHVISWGLTFGFYRNLYISLHQKIIRYIRISPFKPSQATQRPYNFIHLPWKQLAVVNFISHEECNFCFRVMKCLAGAWSGAERSGAKRWAPETPERGIDGGLWWAGWKGMVDDEKTFSERASNFGENLWWEAAESWWPGARSSTLTRESFCWDSGASQNLWISLNFHIFFGGMGIHANYNSCLGFNRRVPGVWFIAISWISDALCTKSWVTVRFSGPSIFLKLPWCWGENLQWW